MLRSEMMARISPEEFLDEMAIALIDAEDRQSLLPKSNINAQQPAEDFIAFLDAN